MSEKNMQNKSQAPLIATIIVAFLALAAVIALIVVLTVPREQNDPSENSGFVVTKELEQECQYAAHDLVSQSYEIMRLFVFEGLTHIDEPYGNEPEDGYYTVYTENNNRYTTIEDIESLVKSVYTDKAAEKIMHNIDGNGLEVYKNRKVLVEAEYDSEPESGESRPMYVEAEVLGISAKFIPNLSKRELWADCSIMFIPTSETSCEMKVYLGGIEEGMDLSEFDESLIVELEMIKTGDNWRLTEFVC